MSKTVILKSAYLNPLSEEEIIRAVQAKKKGVFRKITYLTDIVHIGSKSDEIAITKTKWVRMNIIYDHIKKVSDRKEAEDKAAGGKKDRRKSSFIHYELKDTEGNVVEKDPPFIVRDATTQTRKSLQVFPTKVVDIRTKSRRHTQLTYYKNGIELDPATNKTLIAVAEAKRHKTPITGAFQDDIFALQLIHIIDII